MEAPDADQRHVAQPAARQSWKESLWFGVGWNRVGEVKSAGVCRSGGGWVQSVKLEREAGIGSLHESGPDPVGPALGQGRVGDGVNAQRFS